MQRSIPILWALVIILLIFNLLLLDALNLARLTAVETLSKVETTLDSLSNEVIIYNLKVNQAVPVKVDVPFNRTMEIPINAVIPVDQQLTVPFSIGGREVALEVPIKSDFPIDTVVPVTFNETLNVDTVVQLDTTLPVEIDLAQTPLAGYLKQARQDISRLRNRLALQGTGAAVEEISAAGTKAEVQVHPDLAHASDSSVSPVTPVETGPALPMPTENLELDRSPVHTPTLTGEVSRPDNSLQQVVDLGLCGHAYWPLPLDARWTFNSPATSYSLLVDNTANNQVELSTSYENQALYFSLVCYQKGLGGGFLGDMRRLSALGRLNFSNPRGMFLPGPALMETIGQPWTQEFDVAGIVEARQGDKLVTGQISRGWATATYTPTGFESLETPLGPREALRLEQKLNLNLELDFDLGDQMIRATEIVELTNIYWFAKGIGPVKIHWQGGAIQQDFKIGDQSIQQQAAVPALAEEQLVFVCLPLKGASSPCMGLTGMSGSDLTVPPESELVIPGFIFPEASGQNDGSSSPGPITPTESAKSSPQAEPTATGSNNEQAVLLVYLKAVANLGEKINAAGQKFGQDALAYRDDELTLAEFQDSFLSFVPHVQGAIREINQLKPPPPAQAAHHKLTTGLNQCNEAIELMDQWFDTFNDDTKETVALLVASCMDQVDAARDELEGLAN
ncbi:MAG: hypothetical protein KJ077_03720 [Anaerolineae bacterium]|nr:hypothetical protein [Anaerolineae bacterium]